MCRMPVRLVLVLACAVAVLAQAPTGMAAGEEPPPVASLEPEATQALWERLTRRKVEFRPLEAQESCRPLRAIFYTPGDWLRLATTLAAKASPCAHYYVSI